MQADLSEWLHLLVRWFHVVLGVAWVGQTYLFSWLDSHLTAAESLATGPTAQVWMVHSGGFYIVEKQKTPKLLPTTLHWFRWEAAFTWMSGVFLLVLVYYLGGGLVNDMRSSWSTSAATALGAAAIIGAWLAYDLVWVSPLRRHPGIAASLCFALLVGAAYGLTRVLSGRAAYIHIGAMLGTIMAANVWVRILPAQRQMLKAVRDRQAPDMTLGERAKQRSTHNTFMSVPVIFIMISNHFPTASYGDDHNWLLLVGFVLLGWLGRKLMTLTHGRARDTAT